MSHTNSLLYLLNPELEPEPDAGNSLHLALAPPTNAREVGGFAELPTPCHPDVRCKLACDFITQPQARADVGQAAAYLTFRIATAVKVRFHLGLKDQSGSE